MSCFNFFKCISCCGLGCGLISSISDICKGIRTVKEDIVENIENGFQPKKVYYFHKEGDIYIDLKENEEVHLLFFENKKLEKSSSLL